MAKLSSLISRAQQLCESRGMRMTALRTLTYRLLLEHKNAISAYDLLEKLKAVEPNAKPPTVYRALDFLVAQGFVHKIESTSSFIPCGHLDDKTHCSQLLICDSCNLVTECHNHEAINWLNKIGAAQGFQISHHIIETHGLCHKCSYS